MMNFATKYAPNNQLYAMLSLWYLEMHIDGPSDLGITIFNLYQLLNQWPGNVIVHGQYW